MTLTVLPGLNWIVAALSVGAGVLAILLSASSISRQRSSGTRLAVDEGVDFASLLKQATFHGGELGPSLRRYSTELAERRLSRAREEGGRRATYLTMVMVFFFVPVLLVVLLGPAVVDVGDTLRSVAVKAHKVQPK